MFEYIEDICSASVDIMESVKIQLPCGGGQNAFLHTIKSVLVGVLAHGRGLTIYRTIDTVHKCADLIVHVILSELYKWMILHGGRAPQIFYLEVDGGSENANQIVLAILELLAIKRLCNWVLWQGEDSNCKFTDVVVGQFSGSDDETFFGY